MSIGESKVNISIPATADLTGQQGKFVTLAGALAVKGLLAFPLENDNAAPTKEPCALTVSGKASVILGGTVTLTNGSAPLTVNASGLAVAAVASDHIVGYALQAGSANEWVTALILPNGKA